MANAPWFVTNNTLHNDLKIPYVLTEIRKKINDSDEVCRLKRYHVLDLPFRNQ